MSTETTAATTTTQPQTAPVEQQTIPKGPQVEKVKINGKEVEVSLDELKRAYGLHTAAQSKFEEASRMRKEAEQVKNVFSQKDVNSLLKAGWTEDEIEQKAAEWLVKKAQEKVMTPEQRAAKQREEEYYRLKQAEQDRIRQEKEKVENELKQREAKLYQTAFLNEIAELDKKSPLDLKDPVILSHIINDITLALNKHGYDMGVQEAVKRLEEKFEKRGPVKKEYLRKLLKNTITDVDDSDLEAFLEKGAKGIREKSVEALKRNEAPFAKPRSQTQSQISTDKVVKDSKYYRDLRYGRIKP